MSTSGFYPMPVKTTATRRRKSATTVRKSPVTKKVISAESVTKYTHIPQNNQVTETQTPSKVRPEKPNLTWTDYREDIKVRWDIHVWETQELWKDSKNFYQNYLTPFPIKTVDYLKDSYDRAFNQEEVKKQDS